MPRCCRLWKDTSSDSHGNILARRYLSDGTAVGDTIRVVDRRNEGAAQEKPAIASSGTGEVILAWLDDRRGNFDVYSQRLGPTGTKIDRNTLISGVEESPIPQSNPAAAATYNRYVIVWDQNPLAQGGVGGLLVNLPTAKEGGTEVEEQIPFLIGSVSPGFKYPRVAMAADGRFVVTYWDTSADSARVIAQRFTRDAEIFGPPYSVVSLGGQVAAIPGDVAVTQDSILYTWSDSREGRGWDARVRKVSWDHGGVITAVATTAWSVGEEDDALVLRWSVPRSRSGSLYWVWRETGDGTDPGARPGPDAARIVSEPVGPIEPGGNGYLVRDPAAVAGARTVYWIEDLQGEFAGPWVGILSGRPVGLALRCLDNPSRESVRLHWSAPIGASLSLSIHDVTGRILRDALDLTGGGGHGEWTWDGRDRSGRSVPAGIYWVRLAAKPGGERTVKLLRFR